jgi:hypothetical protein
VSWAPPLLVEGLETPKYVYVTLGKQVGTSTIYMVTANKKVYTKEERAREKELFMPSFGIASP